MKYLFAFTLFFLAASGGYLFHVFHFPNAYSQLCQNVLSRIYLPTSQMQNWYSKCQLRAALVTPFTPRQLIVNDFKKWMSLDGLSHFELQEPAEASSFWTGQNYDHGFEWEYLEQYILVTEVAPNSSADLAGIQRGDLIESFDGKEIHSADLQKSGQFSILRRNQRRLVELTGRAYQKYYAPQFYRYKNKQVLSLTHFFSTNILTTLDSLLIHLQKDSPLVIDLRENAGGDFAIALSFLNRFFCEKVDIGMLSRPKFAELPKLYFESNWSQDDQLKTLSKTSDLLLRTDGGKKCFRGPVQVLISHATASTGELVAQALKKLRKAKVVGEKTSGSLLVGVAREVESLGPGYLLYVPEAIYLDESGQAIESRGVTPDIEKAYRLKDVLLGRDSFLEFD